MSWNGTGTYTRAHASWTNDATNGLAISATSFDAEDNDFAAGIQNCLTIDNQNKPNAALTWGLGSSQIMALTRGSDGTIFSVARTGGSNNPSLGISATDSSHTISIVLNGTAAMSMDAVNRTYTFPAPVTGPTITVNGVSGQITQVVSSGSSSTTAIPDFEVQRAGSTANAFAEGPSIELVDLTNATATILQHSGGQTELWQFNSSTWTQRLKITTSSISGYGPTAAAVVDMTPDKGSWPATISGGFTSNPTGTVKWERQGTQVSVWVDANITGTSNATTDLTISGVPAEITPTSLRCCFCYCIENATGVTYAGIAAVSSSNTILVSLLLPLNGATNIGIGAAAGSNANTFTNSGTKGVLAGWSITYSL